MAPSRSRPEFFVDRSLGGHDVARALRHAGWKIHTHLEVYGARDQRVEDVEWLELCGKRGWGALTMDRRIRYRPAEIAAIRRHRVETVRAHERQSDRDRAGGAVLRNATRIDIACEATGPLVCAVHADRIVRIFP